MKLLITLSFFFLQLSLSAQTKIIAHKSHSGTSEEFHLAFENNLFNIENSDFGMVMQRDVKTAALDSVIFVNDSVAIMVTSEYCEKYRSSQKENNTTKWKAGRVAVYHHPLFSHQHSLDSIKKTLKHQYYFQNNIDSVRFIGYDNEIPQMEETRDPADPTEASIPLLLNDHHGGNGGKGPDLISTVLMLSIFSVVLMAFRSSLQMKQA